MMLNPPSLLVQGDVGVVGSKIGERTSDGGQRYLSENKNA